MDNVATQFLPPLLTAIAGAFFGFFFSRWTKHREILYSKKVDVYSELVAQLVEFTYELALEKKVTTEILTERLRGYSQLQNSFFKASLYMPEPVHAQMRKAFNPANLRISQINETLNDLRKIKDGTFDKQVDFAKFKEKALASLGDLNSHVGPFMPLLDNIPLIIKSLKNDLGIAVLDSKFYKHAP